MARPTDLEKRQEILDGVLRYIAQQGLDELSLRPLAAELGTSARMLVYYFGSKEQMLIQALQAYRPNMDALFSDVTDAAMLRQRLRTFYNASLDGDEGQSVRVLLQILGAACASETAFADYAQSTIHAFVRTLERILAATPGVNEPVAVATILVSALRGIVQDNLITGDAERASEAVDLLLSSLLP